MKHNSSILLALIVVFGSGQMMAEESRLSKKKIAHIARTAATTTFYGGLTAASAAATLVPVVSMALCGKYKYSPENLDHEYSWLNDERITAKTPEVLNTVVLHSIAIYYLAKLTGHLFQKTKEAAYQK